MTKSERKILEELKGAPDGTIRYTGIMTKPIESLRKQGLVEASFDLLPAGRSSRYRQIWITKITEKGRKA